jgi:ankyrin repeat protein
LRRAAAFRLTNSPVPASASTYAHNSTSNNNNSSSSNSSSNSSSRAAAAAAEQQQQLQQQQQQRAAPTVVFSAFNAVVRLLLARQGVDVNRTAQNGFTALYMASQNGHVEVVRRLLARKGSTCPHGSRAPRLKNDRSTL